METLAGINTMIRLVTVLALVMGALPVRGMAEITSMRFLYPSFSGTWAVPWIAKEAGYLNAEGLAVELIRVGGSTRMVAALLGGSAPLIHAGAPAAFAASAAGSDVVIIAAIGSMSPFRLMARPEIKQPADLKGKKAGITTFGSTSDQMVRLALKHFGLEPNKDVALLPMGGQPEAFAAMQSGSVQIVPMSYPLYLSALKLGMRELIKFSDLGFEDVNGSVITTRSYLVQQGETALRFMRAFVRGMRRYRTDKEFSKGVLAKYGKITDDDVLEGTWQEYAPHLVKVPRPSLKAIQIFIDANYKNKIPAVKPESFVDTSLLDQLERSGFIDSVYK
jgi:NitT/TauT family transport system substrate-binding protein